MQNLESARNQLQDTLTTYVDACFVLESSVTKHMKDPANILSKLENEMDVIYTNLAEQLARSRAYIAKSRNKLAAAAYGLPDEIIATIFDLFMHGDGSREILPLKDGIRSTYRLLYTLLAVCSDWLRIGLSTGALWTLVPLIESNSRDSTGKCSIPNLDLKRFTGANLYLAGNLGRQVDNEFLDVIASLGPRLRSLNLRGATYNTLQNTLACILRQSSLGRLADFAVRCPRDYPNPQDYLFAPDSYEHTLLTKIAASLSTLRLCGLGFDWSTMQFTGLVELRVQATRFRDPSVVNAFIFAAASAPGLRDLQLIDVYYAPLDTQRTTYPIPRIPHPACFTTKLTNALLTRPGRGDFSAGGSGFVIRNHPEGEMDFGWLYSLHDSKIDTLMISGGCTLIYELNSILGDLPTIQSLYIGHYHLDEEILLALVRPIAFNLDNDFYHFPKIRALYFWDCTFRFSDDNALLRFKEVVTSHGVQVLGLEGTTELPDGYHPKRLRFDDPEGNYFTAPIKDWFADNVPEFKLFRSPNELPGYGFQANEWRLW